jgi:hypothetical protein
LDEETTNLTTPMKSLFYTILILSGAFLGYDYFIAPPGQKIVFQRLNPPPQKKVASVVPAPEVKPVMPQPMKPVVTETPKPAPTPVSVAPPPPPVSSGPKFEPIETLTGNWLNIPPSVFPREVKLLQEAEFKMSVGASKVAAGGTAYALSAEKGVITLAPAVGASARAQLPVDGTDLKTQLNAVYEKWKMLRAEELKAIAARKQQVMPQQQEAVPSSSEADASGKPVRGADGSYPLLVASMKRGQVTEITPQNIKGWQDPQPLKVQGKDGWAVKVNFEAKTVFGPQPAEAQALILDGRVTGWYFTGSGEEVP